MDKIKVGIVVDRYPVLSQSFINRVVNELSDDDDLDVSVITIYPFDLAELERISKESFDLVKSGRLKVLDYSPRLGAKRMVHVLASFLSYIFNLILLQGNASWRCMLKVRFKYHVKAAMLSSILKRHDYDILHAQFMDVAVYTALAKNISSTSSALFATGRGVDISKVGIIGDSEVSILENKYIGVKQYFFVSKSLLDIAVEKGFSQSKCSVLYSGIDIEKIVFRLPKLKSEKDRVNFIQVGRLVEKKGILLSIELIEYISRTRDVYLTVVGDGPLYSEAVAEVERKGLENQVIFVGPKSNKDCLELMSNSDIILVPSLTAKDGNSEGIPNVAKEAMALGCIVVCSDHAGLKELVEDGVTGYVFKESDILAYQAAVELAINSSSNWHDVAAKARVFVENNFSINNISHEMVRFYKRPIFVDNFALKDF